MSNFEDFKKFAKDTAEVIADKSVELYKVAEQKTKKFAKTTKISKDIAFIKNDLKKMYNELGKKYFDEFKDADSPDFEQEILEIKATLAQIAKLQEELERVKNEEGVTADDDFDVSAEECELDDDDTD